MVLHGKLAVRRNCFLSGRNSATPSKKIIDSFAIVVLADADSYVYRLGTLPYDRLGSLHSNQTVSRLREIKNLHRLQRPKIQDYKAAVHDWTNE